jgi:hypothetical protein
MQNSSVDTDARAALVGLACAILCVTLLGGGVHTPILILVSVLLCAATFVAWRSLLITRLTGVFLALCGATLLQCVPLPAAVLSALSPNAAEVWSRTGALLDEPVRWSPVSLAPGATLIEAAKWASYAQVTALSATIAMRRGPWVILKIIVTAGVAAAMATLLLKMFDVESLFGYRPRFAEQPLPIMNPNSLAGFLNLAIFSSFALLLRERREGRIHLYAGAAMLCIGLLLVLASRGAVLSLVLGLLLAGWFVVRRLERGAPRGLLMGATVFAGLLLFVLGARPETWSELGSTSLFKLRLFSRAWALFRDNPWLGVGRGAFETAFGPYAPAGLYTPNLVFTHPENIVLQWLSEWGVVIFGLAGVGLVLSLRRGLLRCEYRPSTRLALVGLAVVLFQNLFDLGSEIPAVMIGMCAVAGALWSSERATQLPWLPLALARGGRVLVVGGCLLLIILVAVVRPQRAVEAREALYVARDQVRRSAGEQADFRARVTAALHQYPGDAYLIMMGAQAWRGSAKALSFASWALERDARHGPAHLFVAEELWSRGAQRQAMLELRLALESWPMLLGEVAQRITGWTQDRELIQQATPDGPLGVELLSRLDGEQR